MKDTPGDRAPFEPANLSEDLFKSSPGLKDLVHSNATGLTLKQAPYC
jgi:hypothetical protein